MLEMGCIAHGIGECGTSVHRYESCPYVPQLVRLKPLSLVVIFVSISSAIEMASPAKISRPDPV